ncbi:MAG: hypothetical protein KAX84_17045, partial [Burkholderiales bacterium]|nr:hypothetical protein [Burkholderiales bacterium]
MTVAPNQGPGPDPSTLAPPIDPTVPSSIYDTTAFLYTGPNPPQTGVVPGTIKVARVAILRGQVLDRSGAALSGVRLTIRNQPELGQTLTRLDGRFDIVVNGGETITLDYAKTGFLPVQRQKAVPWQDFVMVDDVVMIPTDAQMTTIASGAMSMQVARGTVQSDASGTRQGTVMVPAGTSASLVQPDGSLVSVNSISVRLTEYTVGPSGPRAMPGDLPPTSGYTYAVELGADEAVAKVNGRDIVFSQPVTFYVENFLAFPVGTVVPVGYYDRDKVAWVPSQSGRVIKILSITTGMANIDADGDGQADGAAVLTALGVTDAERQQLATLYAVGQTLWRMQTTHFSTWDCNWPFGPPPDAIKPDRPRPKSDGRPKGPCDDNGSIITCESQSLGETINVTGTPFSLHYSSDRARGRKGAYRLQIPLSGATLPASLVRIELTVAIAGRQFAQTFPASINQSHEFEWDGMDAYGRSLEGAAIATVRVGYVYGGVYQKTTRFGYNGDGAISGSQSRQEVTLWQESRSTLGVFRGQVGGWMLDVHHTYDPVAKTLYRGNGRRQDGQDALGAVMHTVAGTGQCCYSGDGGAATQARITKPLAIAYAADGSWYFSDLEQIVVRKVSAEGVITTVAGNNISGFSGDGGPATAASLTYPQGVALGPDGSLYIGDFGRVRRVAPDGTISTFAGNGTHVTSGDGGPATQAGIAGAFGLDLALGADGTLYIAGGGAMRRVSPDGIISSIVVPGTQTALTPSKIALGADGSLYLSGPGHSISRLSPDGVISPVAGTGVSGFTGDGGPAVQARVKFPDSIALGPDGTIYFSDFGNHRVRRIGPDGIINTLTGTGTFGDYGGDGGPAGQAKLNGPIGLAIGPDNALLIADPGNRRVRRVGSPMPGLAISDLVLAATDGTEVYAFAGNGRHLLTRAALSGVVKYQFGYDAQGRLSTVTDRDARVTTISRDAGGSPTAVMSPAGQSTTLVTNGSGWLASIADPGGGTTQLTYSVDGLLMTETDPGGGLHKFTYDAAGRLTKDEGPGGSVKTLTRVENPDGYTITMTTGLGRVSTFQVQELPSGTVRRLTADATGAITESLLKPDGTQTTTYPDGETVTLTAGPDPRLGMQSPRAVKVVRSLPGGQIFTATSQRTATLATPTDLFSLQTLTDSWTIDGQSTYGVDNAATRSRTATYGEGRKV